MKNLLNTSIITLVTAFLLQNICLTPAKAQNIEWTRQFGTASDDIAWDISVDASGVYVAGDTDGDFPGQTGLGNRDAFMRKYDNNGTELWTRQLGTASDDRAFAVSVDASGVYVAGDTDGTFPGQTSFGDRDAFIRKYDANGIELWTRQFGTINDDIAWDIWVDASGVYVSGTFFGTTGWPDSEAFIKKYDTNGTEVWTRRIGTDDGVSGYGISGDASGVYLSGVTGAALSGQTHIGSSDAFIRKYDTNGVEVWTRQFGTADVDQAYSISVDMSGVYLSGATWGSITGQSTGGVMAVYIRKYDANGTEMWTRQFGSGGDMNANVSVDPSGVYVAGTASSTVPGGTNIGNSDAFIRKYDANGTEMWTHQFGTTNNDRSPSFSIYESKVYVTGYTFGTFPEQTRSGLFDAFVTKIITEVVNQIPSVTNAIGDKELIVGDDFTVDLTTVFNDPDGDELSFTVSSSNTSVATATINNNTLTIDAVADGTTTVTVTTDDGNGGTVQDDFIVTVIAANVAPTVTNAIEDIELVVGEGFTVDLTTVFTDADGDDLSFSVSNSNGSKATASINNNTLTVDAVAEGTTTVKVTADDGNGGTVQDDFIVTVIAANVAPTVTNAIGDIELVVGEDFTVDLTTVFTDSDGDALSFSVSNSNGSKATASINNNTLTVDVVADGTTTITVTADDGQGGTVQDVFEVNVSTVTALDDGNKLPKEYALLQNYPNPFKGWTTIPFTLPQVSEVTISVYNTLGKKVEELTLGKLPAGYFETPLNATGFASGVYIYSLETRTYKESKYMILQW